MRTVRSKSYSVSGTWTITTADWDPLPSSSQGGGVGEGASSSGGGANGGGGGEGGAHNMFERILNLVSAPTAFISPLPPSSSCISPVDDHISLYIIYIFYCALFPPIPPPFSSTPDTALLLAPNEKMHRPSRTSRSPTSTTMRHSRSSVRMDDGTRGPPHERTPCVVPLFRVSTLMPPPPPLSPASSRCRSRFSLSLPPHNLFLFPLKMNIYRHGTTVVRDHGEHPPHPTSHPSSSSSSGTPPPPKLGLFSGHDTTLMPILATLGDKVWPGTEWVP